jgi:hypothetical protein
MDDTSYIWIQTDDCRRTIVSDLPNSTNFARSLTGIRRAEPGSEALNRQGGQGNRPPRDRPHCALLSSGWSTELEMMARVKRPKKSSSISTQAG